MSVLQKLQDLKRILDWNLATRSNDILPVINECIKELEETQVKTVKEKEIKQEESKEVIEVKVEVKIEDIKPIEKLRNEYIDKFGKKPFAWWKEDVLIEKLK